MMKYSNIYKVLIIGVFSLHSFACSSSDDIMITEIEEKVVEEKDRVEGGEEGEETGGIVEGGEEGTETGELTPKTTYDITSIISKLTEAEGVGYRIVGDEVYITSTGIPDHKSPYFQDTEWHDDKYEEYTVSGFRLNPNRIGEQSYEFRIPLKPTVATNKVETNMGAMGMAINGVPLYNQYAAGGVDLTREIFSFDGGNGHPDGRGNYHYHIEPIKITEQKGEDALVGILLDGFPVYGPVEGNTTYSSDDLDEYHGHFGATVDFPEGIYHYHITADAPYINGSGFYGVPGMVSN